MILFEKHISMEISILELKRVVLVNPWVVWCGNGVISNKFKENWSNL